MEEGWSERTMKDILIEGAIIGLGRNIVLGKFLGIHKDDPSKTPSSSGEGA